MQKGFGRASRVLVTNDVKEVKNVIPKTSQKTLYLFFCTFLSEEMTTSLVTRTQLARPEFFTYKSSAY